MVRPVTPEVQDDNQPALGGKRQNRRCEVVVDAVRRLETGFWRQVGAHPSPRPTPQLIDSAVNGDPAEPGVQRPSIQTMERPKRTDERLLRRILRQLCVRRERERRPPHKSPVIADEALYCFGIARPGGAKNLCRITPHVQDIRSLRRNFFPARPES